MFIILQLNLDNNIRSKGSFNDINIFFNRKRQIMDLQAVHYSTTQLASQLKNKIITNFVSLLGREVVHSNIHIQIKIETKIHLQSGIPAATLLKAPS